MGSKEGSKEGSEEGSEASGERERERAYSARNRSGCVRIPWTESPKAKRVEARFPDPAANPYLAFSALLMAGLDGIQKKTDPGEPSDKDLYDLPAEELDSIPTVCG